MPRINKVKAFFQALRQPYAWPGGYSVRIYLSDGEVICHECAKENAFQIGRATRDGERNGWAFMGANVRWEGPAEHCCECNESLPSEYGDPDAVHLLPPRGDKALCGASVDDDGGSDADIERVTCDACWRAHEELTDD